ncbi:phage integrase (plasmid) [Stanieria sp. NIES-3757]|nr:phage integrase [Stanieria sp. NIES-3757]
MMEIPEPKLIFINDKPANEIITDFRATRVDEYFRSMELSANSIRAYRRALTRFLAWTDKTWHLLKHQDLDRYKAYLKELELSNATICQELAALKSFFNWLTIKDYISKDPTLTLTKPKLKPPTPQELSDEEVKSLFAALLKRGWHRFRDTALLRVLEHGLRASEVTALNIKDYDGKRLHILEAKRDSVGIVPLLSEARKAIDAYLKWREVDGMGIETNSALFLSHSNKSKGKRLTYDGLYGIVKDLVEIAGLEKCYPHRLRHTLATNLALSGMDSMLARRITRHRSEASYQRYSERGLDIKAQQQFWQLFDSTAEEV